MRQIYGYVRNYLRDHAEKGFLASVLASAAVLLLADELWDLEGRFLRREKDPALRMLLYAAVYLAAYVLPTLHPFLRGRFGSAKERRAWLATSVFAVCLFAAATGLHHFYVPWIAQNIQGPYRFYIWKLATEMSSTILMALGLAVFYRFLGDKSSSFFGLRYRDVNLRPYFIILALFLPVVIAVSFTSSFQATYPRLREHVPDVPFQPALYLLYEILYGFDFFFIEMFFRGFLILQMRRYLGDYAVWPAAFFYFVIHFGKPPLETASSLLGGVILGVVVLRTGSVFGGAIIHMGLAWMMELAAWMQIWLANKTH